MISIKGGWLGRIPLWKRWEEGRKAILSDDATPFFKHYFVKAADWALDGTQLSWFAMTALFAAIQPDWHTAVFAGIAWWLFVMSSMGEEAGAVGDYTHGWGDYVEHSESFGRSYGVKKALQYGMFGGGLMALATGWVWFIPVFATFPIVYFAGTSLYTLIHKQGSWAYSEVLYDIVILSAIGVWNFNG